MILIHFCCPHCYSDFWLRTRPGTVSCPNPSCELVWAPRTMAGYSEQGVEEAYPEFDPQT
jgi:hypothetical protein